MAIGRISGSVLKSNLTRNGVDLAFETNLLYLDVTNSRVGIGTSEPATALHVNGTFRASSVNVNNAYTLPTSDGSAGQQLQTDGSGNLTFVNATGSDNITITGNQIKTTLSNSDLELSANGTGSVTINDNLVMNGNISSNDSSNVNFANAITANTGTSQFYNLQVNNEISLGGAGSQYLAFNEDSVKVKFANWYSSNDRQYGQGQLWYEMFFAAVDNTDTQNRRRIGFYLDKPNKGATNAEEGSGAHPNNHRAFIDNDSFTLSPKAPLRFEEEYDDSSNIYYTQLQGQSALSANRTITLPDATGTVAVYASDGSAGQVLQTDGSGTLSFADLSIGDLSIVGSTISSPSNADLTLATAGSGTVVINGLSFPTGDGSANQVLATNGSGQLTFVNSGAADTDSDEAGSGTESTDLGTGSSVINSSNVNTYDSAFYFLVTRDEVNQTLDLRRHSLTHNDSNAFVNTFGQVRSDVNGSYITVDADVSSNLARLTATGQSVSNSVSLYRIVLGQDTSASTDGNTAFIVNSDVDSATENLDTWSASTYRGAQYFISATNSTTGESSNMEALVVTDGTDAYITPYGNVNTGNNDLVSLSADVSGGNVRLRATAGAPNTRVAMYRILLGDSESASSGSSVNVIGATTVSSASTTLDSFSSDDYHGAMYLVVGHNSTEGASSVSTVYMLNDENDAFVSTGPTVSSKGTDQLTFTGSFSGGTATLSCSSSSGGSTTVNAYRIHLKRGAANTVTTNTTQTISGTKTFTSAILADTIRSPGSNADILLDPQGTGAVRVGSMTGSANEIVIVGDANGQLTSTDLIALDTGNNRIGVGTTSPITKFHIAGDGNNEGQIMIQQAFDGADGPDLRFRSSRGTIDSLSAVQSDDTHGRVNTFAYNGSSFVQSGTFGWSASDGNGNNYFDLRTRVSGTLANRIEVTTAGAVRISGAYNLPTADGSANQVLRTNGSDTVSFGEPNLEIVNALSAAASVALDPTQGGIQTITLGQATTFTLSNWASGHRMTLMIDDGTNYAVTWPTMQWAGGVAPTLATSGYNTIELWYVGSTLYGAYVGAHS